MTPEDSARQIAKRAAEAGKIAKSTSCDKCNEPLPSKLLNAYHVDPSLPLEVTWLCRSCYWAARPAKKRKQALKSGGCPDYQVMKADWANGLSLNEMAAKYGIKNKSAVWHTLRSRARAHGEWPLPKPKTTVQINVIWDLVKHQTRIEWQRDRATILANQPVWVAQKAADEFAPRCRHFGWPVPDSLKSKTRGRATPIWRELWPVEPPTYHLPGCHRMRYAARTFDLLAEEAEDWGYRHCQSCLGEPDMTVYAMRAGLSREVVERINRGDVTEVPFATARALLSSINEPVPDSLWAPAERRGKLSASSSPPSRAPRRPSTASPAS